jgi:hypothetical protein
VLFLGHDDQQSDDSRSGSVNGGRSDQGNITIDGLDDNDQGTGYAFTGMLRETLDSVEEFRVATSNTDASSGRSSGSQISLVAKSSRTNFMAALTNTTALRSRSPMTGSTNRRSLRAASPIDRAS